MLSTMTTTQDLAWDKASKDRFGRELDMDVFLGENPSYLDYMLLPSELKLTVPDVETTSEQPSEWVWETM